MILPSLVAALLLASQTPSPSTTLSSTASLASPTPPPISLRPIQLQARATTTSWSNLGCRSDASTRALTATSTQTNGMTVELCESFCGGKGYSLAAVESGNQCFCGNAFANNGGASASGCNYNCAGNSAETCGGSYRMNVYSLYAGTAPATSATTTTHASASTTTSATSSTTTSATASWASLGCRQDGPSRALTATSTQNNAGMTIEVCEAFCLNGGYALAGVEAGNQCFCGNGFANGEGASASGCTYACAGNKAETCGGSYLLNIYSRVGASTTGTVPTVTPSATTTSHASTTTTTTTTGTSKASTTTAATGTTSKASTTTSASSSPTTVTTSKYVFAHHIVGNTYPYTQSDWANDISLAAANGIDGFALNYGPDSWQPGHLSDAYAAALAYGPSFKLFLSADMSVLPSSGTGDATTLANQIKTFAGHPNQLTYNGGLVLSTFSGETSQFGYGSVNAGWQAVISQVGVAVTFIPAWFVDPSTFSSYSALNGAFNWNGGWPMSNTDITFSSDQQWLSGLNGKLYIAPVTPNFFTHYSPQTYNKNFIYRNDDNLYATRWDLLIQNRNSIALAEILTWNDYGESHYIGPIEGAQPNSQAWTTGFPHTAWLDMTSYYSSAFKTGSYPAITKDKIYMYARPHPKDATASNDSVGRPTGYDNTADNFYVVVFATAAGTLTLSNPPSTTGSTTVNVVAGVNKFSQPLQASNGMRATLVRGSTTVLDLYPSASAYTFNPNPQQYNFNAYVTSAST